MSENDRIDSDKRAEKSCPLCAKTYTGTDELFCAFDGKALTIRSTNRANVDIHSTPSPQARIDHQY